MTEEEKLLAEAVEGLEGVPALLARLAAEKAKTAKLVEAGKLARESIAAFMQETNRTAESGAGDILAQLDAAIGAGGGE